MNKITAEHLARDAYVYVRQSTADQLLKLSVHGVQRLECTRVGRSSEALARDFVKGLLG